VSERTTAEEAVALFRQHGGMLRTSEALRLGIHPRTLYALRDAHVLEQLARGLYRLVDLPPLTNPDLVTVALKIPQGVVCLVSALAFHELTTQIPHAVDVALESGSTRPRLAFPPVRVFWFSGPAWSEGIEVHQLDNTPIRIYGPEKSVADAFKFRRKLGLDLALEALKAYRRRPEFDVGRLLHYADVCRVEQIMSPYLEALL
jgi:predicted transcriptional regulator of viral defense system